MVAMNSIAPHVEKGTKLTLDQFLIKYGEAPEEDRDDMELGEPEVWFDQSLLHYSQEQMPITNGLG